jgi:hypothetical protein
MAAAIAICTSPQNGMTGSLKNSTFQKEDRQKKQLFKFINYFHSINEK